MWQCAFCLKNKVTLVQINETGITDVADYLQLGKYIRLKKYLIYEQVDMEVKT